MREHCQPPNHAFVIDVGLDSAELGNSRITPRAQATRILPTAV
jgi:hypothetical protein